MPLIDLFNLLRDYIHGDDFVMLGQKNCQRQSHISGSCYCDFHIDSLSYSSHTSLLIYRTSSLCSPLIHQRQLM